MESTIQTEVISHEVAMDQISINIPTLLHTHLSHHFLRHVRALTRQHIAYSQSVNLEPQVQDKKVFSGELR
jgi:hypothetical protein